MCDLRCTWGRISLKSRQWLVLGATFPTPRIRWEVTMHLSIIMIIIGVVAVIIVIVMMIIVVVVIITIVIIVTRHLRAAPEAEKTHLRNGVLAEAAKRKGGNAIKRAQCQNWAVTFIHMPMPKTVCRTTLYDKIAQLKVCITFRAGVWTWLSQLKNRKAAKRQTENGRNVLDNRPLYGDVTILAFYSPGKSHLTFVVATIINS